MDKSTENRQRKVESWYTVGLARNLANQVERYAETVDTSMGKAIAALVRLGLVGQENRMWESFKAKVDPSTRLRQATSDLGGRSELVEWQAQHPDVPDGGWYKDFGTFKLCGTGQISKHVPDGPDK